MTLKLCILALVAAIYLSLASPLEVDNQHIILKTEDMASSWKQDENLKLSPLKTGKMELISSSETVHIMRVVEEVYRQHKTGLKKTKNSACSCQGYTCGCCVQINIPIWSFNQNACFTISYLPDEFGIQVQFTLDGKVIFNEKISAKNPPPLCARVPEIPFLGSLCMIFYNLTFTNDQLSGCIDIEAKILEVVIEKYSLGCFHIPPSLEKSSSETPITKSMIQTCLLYDFTSGVNAAAST